MVNHIDCDVRFASHARQIARVNADGWMRPMRPVGQRQHYRRRMAREQV